MSGTCSNVAHLRQSHDNANIGIINNYPNTLLTIFTINLIQPLREFEGEGASTGVGFADEVFVEGDEYFAGVGEADV